MLIPTIPGREDRLACLLASLEDQCRFFPGASVHVVPDIPNAPRETIGKKRERAIAEATADYVAFIDDDDMVSQNYLGAIMPLLETDPDCVGITVAYYENGQFQNNFRHGLQYRGNVGWRGLYRTPHHLCPIRREIAASVPFRDVSWGEDFHWAMEVLPKLHTGEFAGVQPIYNYMFVFGKSGSAL
jgi:glycosyltransferase involved in cell wall biosynthesis